MAKWDGQDRRHMAPDGRDGRRAADWHCGDHVVIQESTREHRAIVCGKITSLKQDSEKDLASLREYHDADLEDIKVEIAKKADGKDLRGMLKLVSILIGICCAVVAGQAVWLKSDIGTVTAAIQRLNIRVTEGANDRMVTDIEQTKKLESISGQLGTITWRLTELEETQKKGGTK